MLLDKAVEIAASWHTLYIGQSCMGTGAESGTPREHC